MKEYRQVVKFVWDNALQMRGGFSYNPNVFRDEAIPGASIPGQA